MATKKATKKKAPVARFARTRRPTLRPRVVKREVVVLSATDPNSLAELVNEQLALSVDYDWNRKEPTSGVTVEPRSAILCAPAHVYAMALELSHWEL